MTKDDVLNTIANGYGCETFRRLEIEKVSCVEEAVKKAMELYAEKKCLLQRELCAITVKSGSQLVRMNIQDGILNATLATRND